MSEKIPPRIFSIWRNLSFQMQARIKAFGLEPKPLNRSDFSREEWQKLSPQMRARIVSNKSMGKSLKNG